MVTRAQLYYTNSKLPPARGVPCHLCGEWKWDGDPPKPYQIIVGEDKDE